MAKFTWTVQITVDEVWVADGFECEPSALEEALDAMLPFAMEDERSAKVVKSPSRERILKAQGYPKEEA